MGRRTATGWATASPSSTFHNSKLWPAAAYNKTAAWTAECGALPVAEARRQGGLRSLRRRPRTPVPEVEVASGEVNEQPEGNPLMVPGVEFEGDA